MPPNLGGFFMVRSYYPSECHADYFDFERIEALKPDRKSGSAGMPRPISYAVFCLKKKKKIKKEPTGTTRLPSVPETHDFVVLSFSFMPEFTMSAGAGSIFTCT